MYIPHKFTTLNKYIQKERTNKYIASKIKRDETYIAYIHLCQYDPIETPCKLKFTWHVVNKRTDLDNWGFCKKFVLDGMVKAGIIPDDSMKYITGLQDEFVISKEYGVKIEVIE